MKRRFRSGILALPGVWAALAASPDLPALEAAPAPAALLRSDADREAFLLQAKVVRTRPAPGGVTGSTRATLLRDGIEHDAHIQIFDRYRSQTRIGSVTEMDFRDSWRNNVAAYRLDRLLGLGMVPVTVVRHDPETAKLASFTWWVDEVLMTEKERYEQKIPAPDAEAWDRQMSVVRLFDQLIYNFDRNLGNLLIDKDWAIWMIDHTRAFKVFGELQKDRRLTERCEKDLLLALRALDKPALEKAMRGVLTGGQIKGLLARRDLIVEAYEQKIAAKGEAQVLYDLPPRLTGPR